MSTELLTFLVSLSVVFVAGLFFFSERGERAWNAFAAFAFVLNLWILGAIVYVATHFITKYW